MMNVVLAYQNRLFGAAFRSWKAVATNAQIHQYVMKRAKLIQRTSVFTTALHRWRGVGVSYQYIQGKHIHTILKRMRNKRLFAAIRTWRVNAYQLSYENMIIQGVECTVLPRMADRKLSIAFEGWKMNAAQMAQQALRLRPAIMRLMEKALASAWSEWTFNVSQFVKERRILVGALASMFNRLLSMAFKNWQEAAGTKAEKQLISRFIIIIHKRHTMRSFHTWWENVVVFQGLDGKVSTMLIERRNRRLLMVWNRWENNVIEKYNYKRVVEEAVTILEHRKLAKAITIWQTYLHGLPESLRGEPYVSSMGRMIHTYRNRHWPQVVAAFELWQDCFLKRLVRSQLLKREKCLADRATYIQDYTETLNRQFEMLVLQGEALQEELEQVTVQNIRPAMYLECKHRLEDIWYKLEDLHKAVQNDSKVSKNKDTEKVLHDDVKWNTVAQQHSMINKAIRKIQHEQANIAKKLLPCQPDPYIESIHNNTTYLESDLLMPIPSMPTPGPGFKTYKDNTVSAQSGIWMPDNTHNSEVVRERAKMLLGDLSASLVTTL